VSAIAGPTCNTLSLGANLFRDISMSYQQIRPLLPPNSVPFIQNQNALGNKVARSAV
jgi:hypothetical protein